jgi:hypothetical protein
VGHLETTGRGRTCGNDRHQIDRQIDSQYLPKSTMNEGFQGVFKSTHKFLIVSKVLLLNGFTQQPTSLEDTN